MQLGFIGLGQMGRPIALNLLGGGADLVVLDSDQRRLDALRERGARGATRVAELADAAVTFLCLPHDGAVRDVLLGADGLLPHLEAGRTIVDLSTITHAATAEIARTLEARGVAFLDAPVSGMEARAIDGTLTIMCGGTRDTFERVKPLLGLIGDTVLHMGPSGSGQLTKLINQLLFDINAAALAEVLPMAAKMGLDPGLVGAVVNSGSGRSFASEFFLPRILKGHFADGYPMAHAYKDLVSGAELSARHGIPMPVLAAATATYQAALLRGHGAKDKGAMVLVFEDLLDVAFRDAAHRP